MKSRSKARVAALQALYELDMTEHGVGPVLEARSSENELDDAQYLFSQQIVAGVRQNATQLDGLIANHAPEWPMDQVAVIDRNILRMALWELTFFGKTPLKVAINEAVELAKSFGTDSSPRFVNGVLGSLADNLNQIIQKIGKSN